MKKSLKKKKVNKKCQKFVDGIISEQQKEFHKAEIESVLYGMAFLIMTPDHGIRHIPLEAIQKGEIFGTKTTAGLENL